MASSTVGQLAPFIGSSGAQRGPLAKVGEAGNVLGARLVFGGLMASGFLSVGGHTYAAGSPAIRRITILTQPPRPTVVYECVTDNVTAAFTKAQLPAGDYMVIDSMTDNTRQAQVYDWVVAA